MIIGISLNEVLRSFLEQLAYVHKKYYKVENNIEDVHDFDTLYDFFGFENIEEFNNFLYNEASLEIFGHADQIEENLIANFNSFLIDIEDEEIHNVKIVSLEINKSIPATLYFLSKLGCKANDIHLVKKYKEKWDNVDVLITANPRALELKPDNKISVKIKTGYNKDVESDYEIDSILEFINNEGFRDKVLNTRNTTYYDVA